MALTLMYIAIAAFCGLMWLGYSWWQGRTRKQSIAAAEEFEKLGRWQDAAKAYKTAIMNSLDSPQEIENLIVRLGNLYRANGVQADLGRLRHCPSLLREISDTKTDLKRQRALVAKLYAEIAEFLEKLP